MFTTTKLPRCDVRMLQGKQIEFIFFGLYQVVSLFITSEVLPAAVYNSFKAEPEAGEVAHYIDDSHCPRLRSLGQRETTSWVIFR